MAKQLDFDNFMKNTKPDIDGIMDEMFVRVHELPVDIPASNTARATEEMAKVLVAMHEANKVEMKKHDDADKHNKRLMWAAIIVAGLTLIATVIGIFAK